jgi:hypothetical protein
VPEGLSRDRSAAAEETLQSRYSLEYLLLYYYCSVRSSLHILILCYSRLFGRCSIDLPTGPIALHICIQDPGLSLNPRMHQFLGLYFRSFVLLLLMDAGVIGQKHPRNGACIIDPLHLPNSSSPTEPFSLPAAYAAAALPQDPTAQLQIHNTLGLYPLSIDSKNFAALDRVFTCDVVANYSAPLNVITGLSHLQEVLSESLFYVTTQHSFATQVIDVLDEGREAKSLTYFTATHFGQGDFSGQVRFNVSAILLS